jgi:hypothetical protein
MVCGPNNTCADPAQVTACSALSDGDPCTFGNLSGSCVGGLCEAQVCGDRIISGLEECEETNLNGATCLTYGFYEPAGLACSSDCRVDTQSCLGKCGDGIRNGPELCDTVPGNVLTCREVGFDYGSVTCAPALCAPDYNSCVTYGWRTFEHSGDYPQHMWSPRYGETYLVPGRGEVFHVTEVASETIDVPQPCGPESIWVAPDGTIVVGEAQGAGRVCTLAPGSTTWIEETQLAGITNVTGLWGTALTDIYGAGDGIIHFDGSAWSRIAVTGEPASPSYTTIFGNASVIVAINSTAGVAVFDGAWHYETVKAAASMEHSAWVDADGTAYTIADGAAYKRTTSGWAKIAKQPSIPFKYVWGLGTNAVYFYSDTPASQVWFYDGASWLPFGDPTMFSFSYFGGGPDHLTGLESYFYLHESLGYDWTPTLGQFTTGGSTALWASASDNLIVTDNFVAHHFDGGTWTNRTLPELAAYLWGASPTNVIGLGGASAVHFNGTTWTTKPVPGIGNIFALWGESATRVFAVGHTTVSPGTAQIFMYDGTAWSLVFSLPSAAEFSDVWGSTSAGSYALLQYTATMYHLAPGAPPSQWTPIALPEVDALSLWGDDTALIVMFRSRRTYQYSYASGEWKQLDAHLVAAPGLTIGSAGDVWGIATGRLVRWDGATWGEVRMPADLGTAGAIRIAPTQHTVAINTSNGIRVLLRPR